MATIIKEEIGTRNDENLCEISIKREAVEDDKKIMIPLELSFEVDYTDQKNLKPKVTIKQEQDPQPQAAIGCAPEEPNDNPFQCDQCDERFRTQEMVQVHSKSHSSKTIFECEVCGKMFLQMAYLRQHQAIHNRKQYPCTICGEQFSEPSGLAVHMPLRHSDVKINEVGTLLSKNFSSLKLEEKLEIKRIGRPCPQLTTKQKVTTTKREYDRKFNSEYYKTYEWLCGCEIRQKLFCFCCLLFGGEKPWSKLGVNDFNHLPVKLRVHDSSITHIRNSLKLNLLGKGDIRDSLSDAHRKAKEAFNAKVTQNRYVLNILINCVKFCGCFELALQGHDKTASLNPGVFRGLVNFSAELDQAMKVHLEKSTVFSRLSKGIQNDLLSCMLEVCQDEITKEINNADFFSVIADETSDVGNIFQLAILFRYIVDDKPVERFFTFRQPTAHDADGIAREIKDVILSGKILNVQSKLIAQTYDGASVMNGCRKGVQATIKEEFPHAHFVHCHAQQINSVIAKAASFNTSARVFFANVTGICTYFGDSPQRMAMLDALVKKRPPRQVPTTWNFQTRSVTEIFLHRELLRDCFKEISEMAFRSDTTVQQADGFYDLLGKEEFVFWLELFNMIMPKAYILYGFFQKRDVDPVMAQMKIDAFEKDMQKIRYSEFLSLSAANSRPTEEPKRARVDQTTLKKEGMEVIDVIISEIKTRFSFKGHLVASSLLLSEKFDEYSKKFPRTQVEDTASAYPFFNVIRLCNELKIAYSTPEFKHAQSALSVLSFIKENEMSSTLRETEKLASILGTIPFSSTEAERKRIKTFLLNSMAHDRLTALAMLSVEKDLVHRIPDFNERVIEKFIHSSKDRRIDLIYK